MKKNGGHQSLQFPAQDLTKDIGRSDRVMAVARQPRGGGQEREAPAVRELDVLRAARRRRGRTPAALRFPGSCGLDALPHYPSAWFSS